MANTGANVTEGATTGAAVGTAVPLIGTAIGGAIGGVFGFISGMKGKTAHLDFNTAANIGKTVAAGIVKPLVDLYGYNTPKFDAYSKKFCAEALKKIQSRVNSSSTSWQYWIGNAIQDLTDRYNSAHPDASAIIYVYALYVGMNYDASRPEEFKAVLENDFQQIFNACVSSFPETSAMVEGVKNIATNAPTKSSSLLGSIFGGDNTTAATKAAPGAATSNAGLLGAEQGKIVAIAGFIILIIGFLLFTKKKR
jgi:hypothetical protein